MLSIILAVQSKTNNDIMFDTWGQEIPYESFNFEYPKFNKSIEKVMKDRCHY